MFKKYDDNESLKTKKNKVKNKKEKKQKKTKGNVNNSTVSEVKQETKIVEPKMPDMETTEKKKITFRSLWRLCPARHAVLLVSLELDEILDLSDRIAVISHGAIVGIVDAAKTNENEICLMMTGVRKEKAA